MKTKSKKLECGHCLQNAHRSPHCPYKIKEFIGKKTGVVLIWNR